MCSETSRKRTLPDGGRSRGSTREEAVLRRRLSTAQDRVREMETVVRQAAEDLRLGEDASAIAGRLEQLADEPPHYTHSQDRGRAQKGGFREVSQ